MLRFLISRIFQGIVVIFAVICIMFVVLRLSPGGPFRMERASNAEALAAKMAYYGLDQPWPVQLGRHLMHYATLDFEESYMFTGRTVDEVIASGFPVSATVGGLALLISLGIGVPLGAMAALKPGSLEDHGSTLLATLGICTPSMVLGPLLAMFFGLYLRWFNASGWYDAADCVLPALTLGLIYSGYIARLTRGSLRETLAQEFIRTARAKGADSKALVYRHALKLACLPVLNYLGPVAAVLLTGSFIVETVYQLPGLGQFFISSAVNGDHSLATAISAFYATLIVLFNLVVDLLQAWLNPRIRLNA